MIAFPLSRMLHLLRSGVLSVDPHVPNIAWTAVRIARAILRLAGFPFYDITPAEIAAGVTPVNYSRFTHPIRDISRHVSDNTGAIDVRSGFQAACNVVENEIIVPDGTYLLSSPGTKTYNSAAHAYCVLLKSGTRLSLSSRATIKLANAQNAHVFMNDGIEGAGNTAIEILGGIFDLNQANQTTHATGEQSAALLHNITRLKMRGSRYINVREYALRVSGITAGRFADQHCTDSDGSGFAFGNAAAGLRMLDCYFDQILAESCLGGFAGAVGNGFIFAGDRCQIGAIEQRLCAFGLKIQNDSSDIQAAMLSAFGTTADHGVKLEGSAAGPLTLTRVTVDNVITSGNYGAGLYMEEYDRVTVRHARSHGDATSDLYPAVWVGKGDRATVDVDVENACNAGVVVRSDATNSCVSGRAKNSGRTTGAVNFNVIGDNCRMPSIHSIQTSGTVTRALDVSGSANHVAVGQLKVDGTYSNPPIQHVQNLSVEQYIRDGSEYVTFADLDATPSVAAGKKFKTFTNALTITDFDDGSPGQEITVISKAAITFDTTGTDLVGSSVDIVTAAGDVTIWISDDGVTWRLKGFVDVSIDNSAGA